LYNIILSAISVFITYQSGQIKVVEHIEESNRIIKPSNPEEYLYEPYEFADLNYVYLSRQGEKNKSVKLCLKRHYHLLSANTMIRINISSP
jgi:hypothetical protein